MKLLKDESKGMTASVIMKLAASNAAAEFSIYEYAVRINRTVTHILDFTRSVISLHKEEMNQSIRQQ